MDIEISFTGKYGEHFTYFEKENGEHIVSCKEIDMKDEVMSKEEFDELFEKYCDKGVLNFDRSDKEKLYSRASNLGKDLYNHLWFFKKNNGTYQKLVSAIRVYNILNDIQMLELTKEEYENHFLKFADKVSEDYVQLMLKFNDEIIIRKDN